MAQLGNVLACLSMMGLIACDSKDGRNGLLPDASTDQPLADTSGDDPGSDQPPNDTPNDVSADSPTDGTPVDGPEDGPTVACTAEMPCTGGLVCIGERGCGGGPWRCVATGVACTRDSVAYCGCDGVTFNDSSTCPTRPYAFMGSCETGTNCDLRDAFCDVPPPRCEPPTVAEVTAGCFSGRCVSSGECVCTTNEECPTEAGCYVAIGRCY